MLAGMIYLFAGSTAPEGYLICDGSNVSRTTYSELFTILGTTYGAGDGSTTFGLPNLSGKVPIGVSSSHTLASTGGAETVTLSTGNLPSHTHTVPEHGHGNDIKATTPSLSHSITQPAFNYSKPNGTQTRKNANPASNAAYSGTSSATASRSTNVTVSDHAATACTMSGSVTDANAFNTEATGDGTAHSNMQPFITLNYIISTGA